MGTLLSSPSFYQHLRHTKRGVIMTLFVLFFPAFSYLGTPKHYKTRENAKWQIDPVLPPPPTREVSVKKSPFLSARKHMENGDLGTDNSLVQPFSGRRDGGFWALKPSFPGRLRGNTTRGNRTESLRMGEICLWEGLWEGRFCSQRLSVLLPLIMLPLNISPRECV